MLNESLLKDVLHKEGLTNIDKLLLCLAVEDKQPKRVKQITEIARNGGLREAVRMNVSYILSRAKGLAIRTPQGWELTSDGREHVSALAGEVISSPSRTVSSQLRKDLTKITDPVTYSFVEEAILCFENKLYRAAVVLSWIGAVSILYDFVVKYRLLDFNTEALRRDTKWKNAKTRDDLARMKETDFLEILESISVIGKSVKQELKRCLDLRNGCGHPNSLKIGEGIVMAHIETLTLNVFSQFHV